MATFKSFEDMAREIARQDVIRAAKLRRASSLPKPRIAR